MAGSWKDMTVTARAARTAEPSRAATTPSAAAGALISTANPTLAGSQATTSARVGTVSPVPRNG